VATRSFKRGTLWRIDFKKKGDFRQKIWAVSFAQQQGLPPTPCHLMMLKTARFPTLTFLQCGAKLSFLLILGPFFHESFFTLELYPRHKGHIICFFYWSFSLP